MKIQLEEAALKEEDARLIMDWRNDEQSLRMSYHQEPKTWPEFWVEYDAEYFTDPHLPGLFAVFQGERVAFVRFQTYLEGPLTGRTVSIGINVAPAQRGKGLGSRIIASATDWAFALGVRNVVAEIKRNNEASIRAFQRAGYQYLDAMERHVPDTKERVAIYRYVHTNPAVLEP